MRYAQHITLRLRLPIPAGDYSCLFAQTSEDEVKACLTKGKQAAYPKKLNEILKKNKIICMRAEHETDMIDKNNLHLIADFFNYLISARLTKSDAEIIDELKAKNQKKIKKLYTIARIVDKTLDWCEVPKVYTTNCCEIIKVCNSVGIAI